MVQFADPSSFWNKNKAMPRSDMTVAKLVCLLSTCLLCVLSLRIVTRRRESVYDINPNIKCEWSGNDKRKSKLHFLNHVYRNRLLEPVLISNRFPMPNPIHTPAYHTVDCICIPNPYPSFTIGKLNTKQTTVLS